MRRIYSDLHLRPNTRELEQTVKLVRKAADLGYRQVAITFPPDARERETRQLTSACAGVGIDVATRVDLWPNTPNDLIGDLRKLRRKFEIICVLCESKNVSRQAAKDRRVDLLNFPSSNFRGRFFDMAEAELASNSLASLEIDMEPLLTSETWTRIRLLSSLRRETSIADNYGVPIVVSSGASDERNIRKPTEVAIATSIFGLEKRLALDTVSRNPAGIVKRNRRKLDPNFIAPGIRILRRGKRC